jgi:hypothetical protein
MNLDADGIQGVLFLPPGQHQDDAIQVWGQLFPNDNPDGFQKASASPSLASTATGERDSYNVAINAQVGRIDIVLSSPPGSMVPTSGPPRISDVRAAASHMAELMKRLVARIQAVRVALILDLAKTVARGSEGRELMNLLPGFPFPNNSTDIGVQFNSRRPFDAAPDIPMNRLCGWSSGQYGFIQSPQISSGALIVSPFVGVKIDVNSAPEFRVPTEKLSSMIDDLLAEAVCIYSDGSERLIK